MTKQVHKADGATTGTKLPAHGEIVKQLIVLCLAILAKIYILGYGTASARLAECMGLCS